MSFEAQLAEGQTYEAYLLWRMRAEQKHVDLYTTRDDQYMHGDMHPGIEIKYDARHHQTGNIYVEVAEKHHAEQDRWIPSGIRCRSDAHWWIIGDYRTYYHFRRVDLQTFQDSGVCPVIEIALGTSRGFLLRPSHIADLAVSHRHWPGMHPLGTVTQGGLQDIANAVFRGNDEP